MTGIVNNIACDGSVYVFDTSGANLVTPSGCYVETDITQHDRIDMIDQTARLTDLIITTPDVVIDLYSFHSTNFSQTYDGNTDRIGCI